jgi:hypothetical protein
LYEETKAALVTRLGTAVDVNDPDALQVVLDYEPQALHVVPAAYVVLDHYERTMRSQVVSMKYWDRVRVCVAWEDNEQAEHQLVPFVNGVPALIDQDPYLLGAVESGFAYVESALAGYYSIGGTVYRTLDVMVVTKDKAGWKSGI